MNFLVIFSLLSIIFQSVGEEKNTDMDVLLYPMISTYASEVENCDVDDLNIDSLSDVKDICHSLINSDVCSNVKRRHLVDCDQLVLNESSKKSQEVVSQAEWPDTSSLDHMKSIWIYNEAESDRVGNRDSDWSNFLNDFAQLEKEPEFSCLNKKGKMRVWRKHLRPFSQLMSYMPSSVLKSIFKPLNSFSAVKLAMNILFYVTLPSAAVPLLDVTAKLIGGPDVGLGFEGSGKVFDIGLASGLIIGLIYSASYLALIGNKDDAEHWGDDRPWDGINLDNFEYKPKKRMFNASKAMNSVRKKKVR